MAAIRKPAAPVVMTAALISRSFFAVTARLQKLAVCLQKCRLSSRPIGYDSHEVTRGMRTILRKSAFIAFVMPSVGVTSK